MVPILTQYVTRFYVNWCFFIDLKWKFDLKMHVVSNLPFWIFGTLQPQKEENLPNQDWAVFVRIKVPSPRRRFWLFQTKPEVRGLGWQPKLISKVMVPILTHLFKNHIFLLKCMVTIVVCYFQTFDNNLFWEYSCC